MSDVGVLYPSEYLKAEDLQGKPVTVRIARVTRSEVPMTTGGKETKTVIAFHGTPKKLIAPKTVGYSIAVLLGRESDTWAGKRVTLIPDMTTRSGEEVSCVRVSGSPDATPERASAFDRAWRGDRKGRKLLERLKPALARLDPPKMASGEGSGAAAVPVEDDAREPGSDG